MSCAWPPGDPLSLPLVAVCALGPIVAFGVRVLGSLVAVTLAVSLALVLTLVGVDGLSEVVETIEVAVGLDQQ